MSIDEVYTRFTARDPLLLVALNAGDPEVTAAVARLLRLTPLRSLAVHQAALVEILAALPELHGRLRSTWGRQDPALTTRLLSWAGQRRALTTRDQDDQSPADDQASADDLATV